jgi:hypothetical protein
MQNIALLSGLAGALISGALAYAVRLLLDRRTQRLNECAIAYVHLVRVSEFIAVEVVFCSIVPKLVPTAVLAKLSSADGAFKPSHKIAVLIAQELEKITPEQKASKREFSGVPRYVRQLLESGKAIQLSVDQLAKLPRETVYAYHKFQQAHSHLLQVGDIFAGFLENDERAGVSPDGIFQMWVTLKNFSVAARSVHLALLRHGAASKAEAHVLLNTQIADLRARLASAFSNQAKIRAALSSTEASSNGVMA